MPRNGSADQTVDILMEYIGFRIDFNSINNLHLCSHNFHFSNMKHLAFCENKQACVNSEVQFIQPRLD